MFIRSYVKKCSSDLWQFCGSGLPVIMVTHTLANHKSVVFFPSDLNEVPLLPSLDYEKVREDMLHEETRKRALLLQALRWVSIM